MNIQSLVHLWNITQQHVGTSSSRAAAGVLLGLYNGDRFPFDLTDLRVLDSENLQHAMNVIRSDAARCQMEVHSILDRATGRTDFGERFEWLAHDFTKFKRGRCKKQDLSPVFPTRMSVRLTDKKPDSALPPGGNPKRAKVEETGILIHVSDDGRKCGFEAEIESQGDIMMVSGLTEAEADTLRPLIGQSVCLTLGANGMPPHQLARPFSLAAHLQRQREWSDKTFGPGERTAGVLDHIRKELVEVAAAPTDTSEWIDVAILAFDGAMRAGATADQVVDVLVAKQDRNESRVWPDWRTMPKDQAIEHDRSGEVTSSHDPDLHESDVQRYVHATCTLGGVNHD